MNRRHLLPTAGAVLAALGSAAAPAAAKNNPYTPREVCGRAFRVIDVQLVRTPEVHLGTTYLLYNPNTGRNCVVSLKRHAVGRPTEATAVLQKQGGRKRVDSGNFRYYAGPLKAKAPGTCVEWGGGFRAGLQSAGFLSGYEHCD